MDPVTVPEGEEYVLPSCGFLPPDGMVFASWNLGRVHAKITVTEDIVLVARWAEIPVRADARLLAKLTPAGNKSLKLTWTKVKDAEGYDIFFGKCLSSSALLASVKPNDRTYTISKLINGQPYKAYVRAWKTQDGKKFYIGGRSPYVHAIVGESNDTYTTQKAVKVKNPDVRIQLGKTHQIQATVEGYDSKKIQLFANNEGLTAHANSIKVRFED